MKNSVKIVGLCLLLLAIISAPVFAQTPEKPLSDIKDAADQFMQEMADSLPFNATIGLNWGDAYIGKVVDAPPHFGIGLSLGYTTMGYDSLKDLMAQFSLELPPEFNLQGYPMIGYALEGRMGGFGLPFDIGLKGSFLPVPLPSQNLKVDYYLAGADIRYAILQGEHGKKHPKLPVLSVGAGFNYLKGGIEKNDVGNNRTFEYTDPADGTTPQTLTLAEPKLGIIWETFNMDYKVQISKTLGAICPYAGFGASKGWSNAGYGVTTTITDTGGYVTDTELTGTIKEYFEDMGIDGLTTKGFSSVKKFDGWSYRVFGGITFKSALIKVDLTGMYNLKDGNYGVSFAIRYQM